MSQTKQSRLARGAIGKRIVAVHEYRSALFRHPETGRTTRWAMDLVRIVLDDGSSIVFTAREAECDYVVTGHYAPAHANRKEIR